MQEDKILKKLDQVADTLVQHTEILDNHSEMLTEVNKKLQQHDKQFIWLTGTVLDHTERFDRIEENMMTKEDKNDIIDLIDEYMGNVKKNDQEITMMGSRVSR